MSEKIDKIEKARSNKKAQEHVQSVLSPHHLYIALYIRSDPPTPNNFHWAFYHHTPATHHGGGTKHEVTNYGSSEVGGWITSHEPASAVFKDAFLCVLIRIADVPEEKGGILEGIMKERDVDLNEIEGVTCRVWLFIILKRLMEEGIVRGVDVAKAEEECMEIGNGFAKEAARNLQPRPVVKLRVCLD